MKKPASFKIDRWALEGDGVGRHKGKVAFVPYTVPGDTIEAGTGLDKKSFSRFQLHTVVSPGAARISPSCPYYFKSPTQRYCGGCNWQHIALDQQRAAKVQLLKETFERIGGVANPPVEAMRAEGDGWRYRNKVQVPFGRKKGGLTAGFYAPQSHEIIEFDDCLIQTPLSVKIVQFVKSYAREKKWNAYDENRHQGWIRHLLIRTNDQNQALVTLVTARAPFPGKNEFVSALRSACPEIIGVHQNVNSRRTNVVLGSHWTRLWGQDHIEEEMLGLTFLCSPGSFFQVHTAAARLLYKTTLDLMGLDQDTFVLDLFCGVGTLTLLAAKKAKFATGVEIVGSAIQNAKRNAQRNHLRNVEFVASPAERIFSSERLAWLKEAADQLVVLVDPPRSGCDPAILEGLTRARPKRIVYVSCHPATLARDVKGLSSYRLMKSIPVDLFPQTAHIESVNLLERC